MQHFTFLQHPLVLSNFNLEFRIFLCSFLTAFDLFGCNFSLSLHRFPNRIEFNCCGEGIPRACSHLNKRFYSPYILSFVTFAMSANPNGTSSSSSSSSSFNAAIPRETIAMDDQEEQGEVSQEKRNNVDMG